ncbi:recombinase family protein [Commensalibacter papalotli (ex Botero et al. 2024)]|uniref:Site-specific DNA recombinase SpoIVCA/DNA invertase PinE (SpoIVCA) (PDB:1GDT) n=1 Tax=Commensalibacter papalotli (ex Botero et al. 2024) TaxID=2972766 RepID=A0ABN8WJI4_9PROT|nr:recombinase family protein [Commensalibacter papalotli (ex Botero et al. 2024)]CAI3957159.1 Site-specific DNA recombinase SpoIVCA/DNA invertase PinE (SpoIVCA) (PDB:1GDT) [Commensalibacter papalotli (ex Botero et al. 2024)]CAI3957886.1 Site-specific DNA recombinase SpoIVCA/DNA invertase PinE (SpoIVCA) (PDB:1GDT) [Commensalibacter papalotli (ex Botero et al. 2024)]
MLTENIDTTAHRGESVFHLFGVLAQFERDLIKKRIKAGLKAARDQGGVGGRSIVMTDEKLKKPKSFYKMDRDTTNNLFIIIPYFFYKKIHTFSPNTST